MSSIFVFLCLLLQHNQLEIKKILIFRSSFHNSTITAISCSDVEYQFGHDADSIIIRTKNSIDYIADEIYGSKVNTDNSYMDARVKMYIYFETGKVDTICLQYGKVFELNNRSMVLRDDGLIKWIDSFDK